MKKAFLFVLIAACTSISASGQSVTHESYSKARPILDKAIAAYGGLAELRSIENVTFRVEGDTIHRNQSRRTFMSERPPYKAEYIIDVKNTLYRQRQEGWYPGGFRWINGFAINKNEGAAFDLIRGTMNAVPNLPPANFRGRLRLFPHFIILNAAERASRLRYVGKSKIEKRPHSVVSYANEDGLEISLYIDDKTGLLSRFEAMGSDPFSGDVVNETNFTGYRTEGNRVVPTGRLDKRSGEPIGEIRIADIVFNKALTDADFKMAPELKMARPSPPAASPVTKIGENIYTVLAGGYNVLFAAFKDHIFVMEAPGGDGVSKQAIEQIKKTVPGKPIRYVAVTHHHDDHAGGLLTYIAGGATVIALPGEKSFFEKIVTSRFTIDPDALTLNPQPLKIEVIENGKRILTDGTTTVELLDIGSGPHTEQMLVAYLPAQKAVFQGDLLNRPSNGDPATINDTTVHFSNWLDKQNFTVEKVFGVHGPPSTREELRQGVMAKAANP